jgi:hypothetical protein
MNAVDISHFRPPTGKLYPCINNLSLLVRADENDDGKIFFSVLFTERIHQIFTSASNLLVGNRMNYMEFIRYTMTIRSSLIFGQHLDNTQSANRLKIMTLSTVVTSGINNTRCFLC